MKSSTLLYKLLKGKKGHVAELVTHARQLGHLSHIVQAMLDEPLSAHCQLARFDGKTMVLVADSPAWANRLRFSITTLLSQLKQYSKQFQELNSIEVRVSPTLPGDKKPEYVPREISEQAAISLEVSASCIEDEALKRALQRLASRKKP